MCLKEILLYWLTQYKFYVRGYISIYPYYPGPKGFSCGFSLSWLVIKHAASSLRCCIKNDQEKLNPQEKPLQGTRGISLRQDNTPSDSNQYVLPSYSSSLRILGTDDVTLNPRWRIKLLLYFDGLHIATIDLACFKIKQHL